MNVNEHCRFFRIVEFFYLKPEEASYVCIPGAGSRKVKRVMGRAEASPERGQKQREEKP